MPDLEGRAPAFYDHETDEPRTTTGRRRRQVADWGVGEDAFDRLPSRRFERRGEDRRHAARHEDFTSREFDRDDFAPGNRFARGEDEIAAPRREMGADRPGEAATRRGATAQRVEETATRRAAVADWVEETATRGEAVADWLGETATGREAVGDRVEETATRGEAVADWLGETATGREAVSDWLGETATGREAVGDRVEETATRGEAVADWLGETATRPDAGLDETATRRAAVADWLDETATRDEAVADWLDETATRDEAVADWLDETVTGDDAGASWLEQAGSPAADAPADEEADAEFAPAADMALRADGPRPRRTIVIGGHPDGLPVIRQRRPAPTAMERVGTRPDRFVAYAVAMGLLLILIAILSTGH
jgi:hypothetical protein